MRKTIKLGIQGNLPELPLTSFTREGVIFSPSDDTWRIQGLHKVRNFKFGQFDNISPDFVYKLKLTIASLLKEASFSHASNIFSNYVHFYRAVLQAESEVVDEITLPHFLSYQRTLTQKDLWKSGLIRTLFNEMDRLGVSVCSKPTLELMAGFKIPGNVKGTSIRTKDPTKGAFNDGELKDIQAALNNAYASNKISIYKFAILWLLLAYGCRPIQIASMKEMDLVISQTNGEKSYALNIPRAKQRGQSHRDSLKLRYCNKQIGHLLEEVIDHNAQHRHEFNLTPGHAPLFIASKKGEVVGFEHHYRSTELAKIAGKAIEKVTNLKGNSRRFRNTLAQKAADQGKDAFTVAELLDHSNIHSVNVYYEATPNQVDRLDKHLGTELTPLGQAFSGVLIKNENDDNRSQSKLKIYDRTLENNVDDPLGNCGQMSFCGMTAPVACYTCRHFQPWIDGPHEAFMHALLEDRKRMQDNGLSSKIYTIRDRTILAAAEIVKACKDHESHLGELE